MNNLNLVSRAHALSPRFDLSDRTRFAANNGHWASLGYPSPRRNHYTIFTHMRADGMASITAKNFFHLADALDYLADWLRANVD